MICRSGDKLVRDSKHARVPSSFSTTFMCYLLLCSGRGMSACESCRDGFVRHKEGMCVEDLTPYEVNCPDGQVFKEHQGVRHQCLNSITL